NIQRNPRQKPDFLVFSWFFEASARFCPVFSGKIGSRRWVFQTAILCQRGSNTIRNRPVAEIMATMNPTPAYASAARTPWLKSLKTRFIRQEPSLMRNKTVGLWEPDLFAMVDQPLC